MRFGFLLASFAVCSISSSMAAQLVMGRVLDTTLYSSPFVVNTDDVQHEYQLDTQPTRAYFEFEVTKQAWPRSNQPRPHYPESMRQAMIEGEVLAQFVVDTLGQAEMETFKVLRSPHPDFTRAVWAGLPALRFTPAEFDSHKVRQLVQEPFVFCLTQSNFPSVRPDTARFDWPPCRRPVVCNGDGR